MILFIFEGEETEKFIFEYFQRFFFSGANERSKMYAYKTNIYSLYKNVTESQDLDIVEILKENDKTGELAWLERRDQISDVYLFFDFDYHDSRHTADEACRKVREMLEFFCDETDNGKLYISYPMVEALYYTKQLPDNNFRDYIVTRDESANFKALCSAFSYYKDRDKLL